MTFAEKDVFHGLRLIASCGSGTYGEVFLCEDLSGKRMAVKIVSKKRLGDAWKRELQGVINYRRITENSSHLLQIFQVSDDEENFYYTMEAADDAGNGDGYVPDTLARRLQSGALPPKQLYPILRGIFDGIRSIHDAGFAHRDIKPDNIIFVNGEAKLGDIGLMSSLSNSMTALAGTLEFLPPEVHSSPGSLDPGSRKNCDLYAFGKVVYCAATGLDASDYPTPPTLADLSSPEYKFFVQLAFRLCATRRVARIASVDALAEYMDRIEHDLDRGKSRPPLRWRVLRCNDLLLEWMRRHVLLALLLVAVPVGIGTVLLILIAVGIAYHFRTEYRSESETPAVTAPPPIVVQPEELQKQSPTVEYAIASPGIKMQVPRQWQIMSDDYIHSMVDEMTKELNETKKSEEAKKYLRHAIAKAKTWKGMIRCDLYDTIEIAQEPADAARFGRLRNMSEAQLRREIASQFGASETKDLELKRTVLAGRDCITVTFTNDRNRIKEHFLLDDPQIVTIALTADAATFDRRVKEFDAMIATLEFTSPPPPPQKTGHTETTKPAAKPTGEAKKAVPTRKKRVTRRSYRKTDRRNRSDTPEKTAGSSESKKSLLDWMIAECPAHRELAKARKKELEEREALEKAGKFDIGNDASRLEEERLWQAVEDAYRKGRNTPRDTGFHVFLNEIEIVRENREKFESSIAASGKQPGGKNVMPELAADIGWENYRMLLDSPRYEKIVLEHEAEVAAEKERRKNGAPAPEPDSESILEEKLWGSIRKAFSMQQILLILDHIEYVRNNRGRDKNNITAPPKGSKKLINGQLKAYLYIPGGWTIAFPEGRDPSDTSDNDFSPKQLNMAQKKIYDRTKWFRGDEALLVLYCDKDKKWRDTIYMRRIDDPSGHILYRTPLNNNDTRTRLAGRCCVITKHTDDPGVAELRLLDIRQGYFCIDDGEKSICFNVHAKKETFDRRMQELEAAIKTMKFEK